jgi:acetyl-CoA acetyltransferase
VPPRAAAVVGIGQSAFSKHLGMSEAEVAVTAVRAALEDAGLSPRDVDGICLYDIESTTVGDVVALVAGSPLEPTSAVLLGSPK